MGRRHRRKTQLAMAPVDYLTSATVDDVYAADEVFSSRAPTTTKFKGLRHMFEPRLALDEVEGGITVAYQIWARPKKGGAWCLARVSFEIVVGPITDGLRIQTASCEVENDEIVDQAEHRQVRDAVEAAIRSIDQNARQM